LSSVFFTMVPIFPQRAERCRKRPSLPTEVGEPLVRARLQADHTQGGMRVGELG